MSDSYSMDDLEKRLSSADSRPRILVVEDDENYRLICKHFLSEEYDVDDVGTRNEAISALFGMQYDLVLMDVGLGMSNGLDIIEQVSASLNNMPGIIVMTAYRNEENVIRALKLGAKDYLIKSMEEFTLDALADSVRKVVSMRMQRHISMQDIDDTLHDLGNCYTVATGLMEYLWAKGFVARKDTLSVLVHETGVMFDEFRFSRKGKGSPHILVVEDSRTSLEVIRESMGRYKADVAMNIGQAKNMLEGNRYSLVVLDIGLPLDENGGQGNGLTLLEHDVDGRVISPGFIILTEKTGYEFPLQALRSGKVLDYIKKCDTFDLESKIAAALTAKAAQDFSGLLWRTKAWMYCLEHEKRDSNLSKVYNNLQRAKLLLSPRDEMPSSIREVVEILSGVLQSYEIALGCDNIVPGIVVRPPKESIMRIATNLVENAYKHAGKAEVRLSDEDSYVVMSVINPGEIPKDKLERIWVRGYSGAQSTGLGLDIVRREAAMYGGEIYLNSASGMTEFRVRFRKV